MASNGKINGHLQKLLPGEVAGPYTIGTIVDAMQNVYSLSDQITIYPNSQGGFSIEFEPDTFSSPNNSIDINNSGTSHTLEVNWGKVISSDDSIDIRLNSSEGTIDLTTEIIELIEGKYIDITNRGDTGKVIKCTLEVTAGTDIEVEEISGTGFQVSSKLSLSAGDGIQVTKSGSTYTITALGTLKSLSAGNLISITEGANSYIVASTIALAAGTGVEIIRVGDTFTISSTGLTKSILVGEGLTMVIGESTYTISIDFATLWGKISSPDQSISIATGASNTLTLQCNLIFVGDEYVGISKDGNTITITTDVNAILGELDAYGDDYVALTKVGNSIVATTDVNAILDELTASGDDYVQLIKDGNSIVAAFIGPKIPTTGTGLLAVSDGVVSIIPIGVGVAVGNGGLNLGFVQPVDCDGESSNSSSSAGA